MDKKETVTKLRTLDELLTKNRRLEAYIHEDCALETLDQLDSLKEKLGPLPGVPSVVKSLPVFPPDGTEYNKAKEETDKSSRLVLIGLGVTALLFVIFLISKAAFLAFLALVAGGVTFVINKTHRLNKEGLAKKEKAYNQAVETAKISMEKFRAAVADYEQETRQGIAAAKEYGQRYREAYKKQEEAVDAYAKKKDDALIQYSINQALIEEHDYIPEEYHHHVPKLISLLQSGRADSYKEALNMAIEEERQDAAEVARQEEEARRLAAMKRQAEEERRHNMMLERQQAEHDRAMERAAQDRVQAERDRLRADERARKSAAQADEDARRRADAQCRVCAKRSGCRNPGVPGCGAFVPRNY